MPVALKLFLLVQTILIGIVLFSIIQRARRSREVEEMLNPQEHDVDSYLAKQRLSGRGAVHRVYRPTVPTTPTAPAQQPTPPPLKVESLLPSWTDDTPAHEVLGIAPNSEKSEIEKAFKVMLKKYHPDRVAQFGKGYQTRAHYIVLRINSARDEMLSKLKG